MLQVEESRTQHGDSLPHNLGEFEPVRSLQIARTEVYLSMPLDLDDAPLRMKLENIDARIPVNGEDAEIQTMEQDPEIMQTMEVPRDLLLKHSQREQCSN